MDPYQISVKPASASPYDSSAGTTIIDDVAGPFAFVIVPMKEHDGHYCPSVDGVAKCDPDASDLPAAIALPLDLQSRFAVPFSWPQGHDRVLVLLFYLILPGMGGTIGTVSAAATVSATTFARALPDRHNPEDIPGLLEKTPGRLVEFFRGRQVYERDKGLLRR